MNITFTEAEYFTIRCSISQSSQIQDVIYIVIVTDTILAVKHIFNTTLYPYQLHSITIVSNLRKFFNKKFSNTILFWDCPNNNKLL